MKVTKRSRYVFPAVALTAVALLTACDPGAGSDGSAPAATKTITASPSPTSVEDALKKIQEQEKKDQKDLKDAIEKATKSAAAASGKVPNVVGMTNAEAIPTLHRAGFMANEEDATGGHRWSLVNSNWKVCRQVPAPGYHPTTLRVAIYSVKLDESC